MINICPHTSVNSLCAEFPELGRQNIESIYRELREGEGWGNNAAQYFRDNFAGIYSGWEEFVAEFVEENLFEGSSFLKWGGRLF